MFSKRLSTCGYKGGIEAVEKGSNEAMDNTAPRKDSTDRPVKNGNIELVPLRVRPTLPGIWR